MSRLLRLGKPHDNLIAAFFLTPFMVIFLTFLVWPILYSLYLSFLDQAVGYSLEKANFIGLANFTRLLSDREFWWAMAVTLYYSLLIIPSGILAALVLAVLLNNRLTGVKVFRAAFFLPNVLDMLVIGIIWTLIYSKDGVFQQLIVWLHHCLALPALSSLGSDPGAALLSLTIKGILLGISLFLLFGLVRDTADGHERNDRPLAQQLTWGFGILAALLLLFFRGGLTGWLEALLAPAVDSGILGNAITVMPAVVFALVIKGAGFGMILFLAAIQNISNEVYEAADIDGATTLQKFKYITLPLVRPVILFMTITGVIGALNAFTEIFAMTKGGPIVNIGGHALGATKLTGYYLFTKWEQSEYGYAAAISYALLVLTLIISVINARVFRSEEG